MNFESHSQAGQDRFVMAVLNGKTDGFYVDIGCSHPVELSNTYALEQLGWRGIGLDSDQNCLELHAACRRTPVFKGDAATFNWKSVGLTDVSDFASVDVDEWTHAALTNLTRGNLFRFRVMTVEHDHYQRGDRLRTPNRDWLMAHGYEIIAADVHSKGCCFEDWIVAPDLVDMRIADRFRSNGLDWADVLKLGGAL